MPIWEAAWRIVGTMFALVLVCLLAFFALRWLSRLQGGGPAGVKRHIHVLDRIGTGRNQSLMLVRVRDTVLLVAVGEHAVATLAEFNAASGEFDLPASAGAPPTFSSALRDAAAKMGLRKPLGKQDGGPPPDSAEKGGPYEE